MWKLTHTYTCTLGGLLVMLQAYSIFKWCSIEITTDKYKLVVYEQFSISGTPG